jgi:hypothetical protein
MTVAESVQKAAPFVSCDDGARYSLFELDSLDRFAHVPPHFSGFLTGYRTTATEQGA